jgi:HEPN domain-containing protein
MPVPREALLQKVRQWAAFADDDLALATLAMTAAAPAYRLVAYHAQQCAEKYLKAFLVFREVDFPFTHKISTLLEICEPIAPWVSRLQEAEKLTVYAVTARYPGVEEQVTLADATEAILLATNVRNVVRPELRGVGLET